MHRNHHRVIRILLSLMLYILIILTPVCALADMEISYLDIDHGNVVLIQCDSHTMLIHTGKNNTAAELQNYLTNNDIKKIDVLVGTDPHADTIDWVDSIITPYEIGSIMFPKFISTMPSFDDILPKISEKGIAITSLAANDSFQLGEAVITILSPTSDKSELTNIPLAMRIDYGKRSFLFPGDMVVYYENEMLLNDSSLKADVLSVGQQSGSATAINDFIKAVSPKYAIISCYDENEGDQPQAEVLAALSDLGIEPFRTDEYGTIAIKTDGESP